MSDITHDHWHRSAAPTRGRGAPTGRTVWLSWSWNLALLALVIAALVIREKYDLQPAETGVVAAAIALVVGLYWRLLLSAGALVGLAYLLLQG